jgi:CheY-like chemotaxis protein/Tfp pilus assembly protein PilF
MLIDKDIFTARALVIDSNTTSRSVMAAQLRDLGVHSVKQVGRINEARLVLEHRQFDIVLCDYHFDATEMSGQDLLDELRREQLLPYSTVFVMVTGEAAYAKVAEAAEAALDSYLLKPHSTAALAERLTEARQRKRVLKDIFEALERQDFEVAVEMCVQRFEARDQYWLYAARIGAELLLRLNRHDEARKLYDAVIACRAVPWARLGVARAYLEAGDVVTARRTLETLIGDMPNHADSYDVMGRVQIEQGDMSAALDTYRRAAQLTPGCLLRQQNCGTLAFYLGHKQEALRMLERTVSAGLKSKLFDMLTVVLIALLRFDERDSKGLLYAHESLRRAMSKDPGSLRLHRFEKIIDILRLLLERKTSAATALVKAMFDESQLDNFDFEAASNLLAVWKRLAQQDVQLQTLDDALRSLAMRYCTSKSSAELLVSATEATDPAAEIIRTCHAEITTIAEEAIGYSMRGQPHMAMQTLINRGRETRNAKLIELAGLVGKRHQERIENSAVLLRQTAELQQRFCLPSTGAATPRHVGRRAGGMVLRS